MLSITKLQNLKAIHNISMAETFCTLVVINHKITKFESNSQHLNGRNFLHLSCYQSQNYKIWKQFTTNPVFNLSCYGCYQSQNYKNWKQFTTNPVFNLSCYGCYQSQNYKNWKQFTTKPAQEHFAVWLLSIIKLQNLKAIHNAFLAVTYPRSVVINHKTTKFESNSQRVRLKLIVITSCYQSQNYKIWKQFTTRYGRLMTLVLLLSITKLQNLKAIHNINL